MSVVPGDGLTETNGTTTFVSDANVVLTTTVAPRSVSSLLMETGGVPNIDDIKKWLSKPVQLSAQSLGVGDTVSTFPSIAMPSAPLSDVLYTGKTAGFFGFRGTMVIRWVINGNRFQQGRYMLCYIPIGGVKFNGQNSNSWVQSHTSTLVQRTQLQRIELDVNCDTEGVMRIPFNSALNYYPFSAVSSDSAKWGTWGFLNLFPYSPLVAPTGSTFVSSTIFCHFEDVELIGTAYQQSGRVFSGVKKKTITEKEQDSAGVGPISSVLSAVSSSLNALVPVPLISSYASDAAWVVDRLSGVAKIFGWSKPVNLQPASRMTRNMLTYFTNVDTVDQSLPLALSAQNEVGTLPGFSGTDIDEMDFSFFFTIPTWQKTATWASTDAVGASTFFFGNHPLNLQASRTVAPSSIPVLDMTPLQYVCNHFRYWRGSLTYTFKFVKTEFHSGRLMFMFSPGDPNSTAPGFAYANNPPWLRREIIDIRDTNMVSFTVPFQNTQAYLPMSSTFTTGVFSVNVLDKLSAPSSVSTSISILLEVSAGPDFEVAVPAQNSYTPVYTITPQSGNIFSEVATAQNSCQIQNAVLGDSVIKSDPVANASAAIGEKISSFRTFAKSMSIINTAANALTTIGGRQLNIYPFAFGVGVNTSPTGGYVETTDLYGELCSIFLYSRGSVRIKPIPVTSTTNAPSKTYVTWINSLDVQTSDIQVATPFTSSTVGFQEFTNGNRTFHNFQSDAGIEFSVPQYSPRHTRNNIDHMIGIGQPYFVGKAYLSTPFNVVISPIENGTITADAVNWGLARGMGDDGNFGTFVSIPPMTLNTGLSW